MSVSSRCRIGAMALLTAALVATVAPGPAVAAPTYQYVYPACEGFDLGVNIDDSASHTVSREFTDRDGNVVRTILAGKGNDLTLANASTGVEIHLKGNGTVTRTTVNADGTVTVASTGHNVILLFPTDSGGPATTLYVGRVVYEVDAGGVFTIQDSSGVSRDICAELA